MGPEQTAARIFDAFSRGDLASIQELVSPDIALHMPGRNRLSGHYRGLGAVLAQVARASSFFDPASVALLGVEVHEGLIVARVEVAAGFLASGRGSVRLSQRMSMDTDGRIAECWVEPDDIAEWDELVGILTDTDR